MIARKSIFFISRAILFITCIFLASCSCYHLGSPSLATLPFKTLYVKPVANRSFVPQAQALLSEQLIRNFQQSGIEVTQCEEVADATLVVVIEKYYHTVFSTRSSNRKNQTHKESANSSTELASSFVVFLNASCTLINNETCEPFFPSTKVVATFNVEANDSVQRVLYQDMPVLTQKLANEIRDIVVGTW